MLTLDTNVRDMVAYRPIGQMTRAEDCRKRLVHTALRLFASRGYYHTSIADILRESDCKRGSLYHYFSSKEELGYAVIDESVRLLVEQGAHSHIRSKEHPIDRLLKVFDDLPSTLKLESGHSVQTGIAASMAVVHEGFRKRLATRVIPLFQEFEPMIAKGIADGQIADSVDPRQLPHFVMVVGYGLQMARQLGQEQLMPEDAKDWIRDYLNSLRK
jgi:TetR/AcrR family transcriptional repressor of nem operon